MGRERIALIAVCGALCLAAAMPAPAGAFLQAHFSDGVLRGIGDPEYDHLGVRCSPRYGATVNGLQPDGEMVACSRVRKIVLLGFGGPDWLDLTNVEAADFTALRKVEGNAGGDSDKLDGASFVPNVLNGGAGSDQVTGGKRADRLYGGSGGDRLIGLAGRDLLVGGPGGDALIGGPGRDIERQ